jgi:hypothetical protein
MRPWIFGIALATAFAAHAQQPAAEASVPVYSVVEPKVPPKPKAKARAKGKAKAKAKAPGERMAQAAVVSRVDPQLKRSGPCVIKPVMSDQDLVNCGATPPRY